MVIKNIENLKNVIEGNKDEIFLDLDVIEFNIEPNLFNDLNLGDNRYLIEIVYTNEERKDLNDKYIANYYFSYLNSTREYYREYYRDYYIGGSYNYVKVKKDELTEITNYKL